jgi:hypothetical protein
VRPYVDPRFAASLRRLRAERGQSLRDLGRSAVYGKSYVPAGSGGQRADAVVLPGDGVGSRRYR